MLFRSQDIGSEFLVNGRSLAAVENLFDKIDDAQIVHEKEKLGEKMAANTQTPDSNSTTEPEKPLIEYDDFAKLDLRIAEIIAAEKVKKSNKLLLLRVRIGNQEKQVLAGIAKHYSPEKLLGKKVVLLNNLKPRKLFGFESQGMILAASTDDDLTLILPESPIPDGSTVQ